MQRFELLHDILGPAIQDWRRTFLYEEAGRQARRQLLERLKRTAGAVIFTLFLAVIIYYYSNWVQTRPWGVMRSLVTGRAYPLSQDVASIGRSVSEGLIYQVRLVPRTISRMHLLVFKNRYALDMRSLLGTTINGELLRYGDSRFLQNGDLIVLAGTASFRFEEINYRPLDFFFANKSLDQPPAYGWALLIDGKDRDVEVLDRRKHFVIATPGGGVRLGVRQEPGTIMAITVRDESELFFSNQEVDVEWVNSREDYCTDKNNRMLASYITTRDTAESSFTPSNAITIAAHAEPVFANIKIGEYCYVEFVPLTKSSLISVTRIIASTVSMK